VPIESSNGFVVSDLPYFKYGLDFLPPNGEITCYWDELNSLLPFLEAKNLQNCIHVTSDTKISQVTHTKASRGSTRSSTRTPVS